MTVAQRGAERLGYLIATRPTLRRCLLLWFSTNIAALWSVTAAPPAFAATMSGTLNWTGITDSHGVPLGAYYLSTVGTSEAITEAGPGVGTDPQSWMRWLNYAVTTGITHQSVAGWLQAQAALYVVMLTVALWLLRFAMSSTWLYWLATWFRPLFEIIRQLMADLWVFPICLALAITVGAFHILWHRHRGRGWGIILSSFAIGIIGLVLIRDPLTELYSDNGLLNQGRNLGFTVAQAALNNGALVPGGNTAQVHNLTGLIADATVRTPLQLWNFGAPVDGIGSCGQAWSRAIMTGVAEAPARAMASCGAPQALSYAQHLDGGNLAVGAFYGLLGLLFTVFVCYVAYSYVMVAGAAFLNALLAVPAAAVAMIDGRPRRRAWRRLMAFFKHALLVFAYVTYISVAAVIVLKTAAPGGYAAQVNMTHPVALLVLIGLISAVATGLFRWLKRELGDHTRDDLVKTVTELVDHGRSGYDRGRRAVERGHDVYDRGRNRASRRMSGDNDDDDRGAPDEPLTGKPVPGRPPTGGAPTGGRRRGPPRGPTPSAPRGEAASPTGGAAPAASRAGTTATAEEAGAAVVAPEVVAGVAVADAAGRRLHRHGGDSAANNAHDSRRSDARHPDRDAPADGRANTRAPSQTNGDGRHRDESSNDAAPLEDDGDPPVEGRYRTMP
jgi:hypothetical protein